jgi:hypothetical protein
VSDLPLVVVAPGMAFEEIAALSTMTLPEPLPADAPMRGVQPPGPHRVYFALDRHSFELPPARFTHILFEGPAATHVTVTPQLDYLSFDATVELARGIELAMRRAGWARILPEGDAPLAPIVEYDAASAADLRTDRLAAQLRMRRIHPKDSPLGRLLALEDDAWLLEVVVTSA